MAELKQSWQCWHSCIAESLWKTLLSEQNTVEFPKLSKHIDLQTDKQADRLTKHKQTDWLYTKCKQTRRQVSNRHIQTDKKATGKIQIENQTVEAQTKKNNKKTDWRITCELLTLLLHTLHTMSWCLNVLDSRWSFLKSGSSDDSSAP